MFRRSSGVLLHVSSLASPYGIGDLGPAAEDWIDWLAAAGCRYWQILPLGPTGFGNSPYSSPSSFAGNVNLISPDHLHQEGLIEKPRTWGDPARVDFEAVAQFKSRIIEEAYDRQTPSIRVDFTTFREAEAYWLEPYTLFMALRDAHDETSWTTWDQALRLREPQALQAASRELSDEIDRHAFGQFLFYRQLEGLRRHATEKGVEVVGDVPLYVAPDSVDVWLHPELFSVDAGSGRPTLIAGVPPDRFSPIGQVWGTPTYRWDVHAADGFSWWVDRVRSFLRHADVLRLDHFTGFVSFYAVTADNPDPLAGKWFPGPGMALFEALHEHLGTVQMVVEDLGPLGEEVERLRAELGFPGMRVLQESFDVDPGPTRTPSLYPEWSVVYTGTHDNDTAQGRFQGENEGYRSRARAFTGGTERTFAWDLVSKAWESRPVIAIAPLQDLLGLGSDHRMNVPGTVVSNWEWRMPASGLDESLASSLADLNRSADRHV